MKRNTSCVLACVLLLAGCGGGAAETRPSASSADERLAQTDAPAHQAPKASDSVKQGEAKLSQGDAAGAKTLFEQALASDTNDSRAALDLGISLEMLEDLPGAEKAYRRAIEINAELSEALNNLGALLRDQGKLDEAIALLQRAAKTNPDSAAVHQNLALALEDNADLDGADREYVRALAITPADAMTRANHGLMLLKKKDTAGAARELKQASQDAQGNRAALVAIGNGLRRAGDAPGAVSAMQAAVQAGDGKPTPALLSELAMSQHAAGQGTEALASLEQALKLDSKYAIAHYLMGNIFASSMRFPEAKKHYDAYLKLEPKGEQAANARERLAVIAKLK